MINGNDIASISVLKDAASSAIYGTRAAFGVILITTKTGKKDDRINIRYNNNFSWDHATYLPDFPDVPTQLKSAILAKARAGSGRLGYGEMRPYVDENNIGDYRFIGGLPMYYSDFDVPGIWYQKAAPGQSHNVSVDGSSGRTTFRMAFGYSGKEDLMPWNTTKRTRYNAVANIQTDVTDWLTGVICLNAKLHSMADMLFLTPLPAPTTRSTTSIQYHQVRLMPAKAVLLRTRDGNPSS